MNKITPHIMNRKRRDETIPVPVEDVPMLEYRETHIVDGVQEFKIHRVPVAEWEQYAKENGL